jgi:adenine-specific DNA methylase
VSGVRDLQPSACRLVTFREHAETGLNEWQHVVDDSKDAWTHYLLTKKESSALAAASKLSCMHRLNDVASIGVSIVTGANDFFTVSDEIVAKYSLQKWTVPLLARTADASGIVFKNSDHEQVVETGKKSWMLNFSDSLPDPNKFKRAECYLDLGNAMSLPTRYKCRIRKPWYRVPDIRSGDLMLSKRAHRHHRLILNQANVVTTDTIYRGVMRDGFKRQKSALIAGFHNSLTILSSELEGRTYGGGVLELIPSELAKLIVPLIKNAGKELSKLDKISRNAGGQLDTTDALIDATDEFLSKAIPEFGQLAPTLRSARERMRNRRFFG